MKDMTLLVMAAGMGSRYGGLKQLDAVGPSGETIIDFSVYDAIRAGYNKVVFIIREDFEKQFKEKISNNEKELSKDKTCSWMEVECLGACINAPMMQINDDYYEDLNKEKTEKIIDQIKNGETPKAGSYKGRKNSEPENNRKTLLNIKNA